MPRNAEQDLALPTGKPLGYYLSTRQSHPAYVVLQKLETRFGSYFELAALAAAGDWEVTKSLLAGNQTVIKILARCREVGQ